MTRRSTKGWTLDYLTDEELLEIIRYTAKELGRTPTMLETPKWTTINRRFGTFNNALIKAGYSPSHELNEYSKEELLELLRKWSNEHGGETPRFVDIDKDENYPSGIMYFHKFSLRWSEIIKLANLKPRTWTGGKKLYYTEEKILELLYDEYMANGNKILRFIDIKKSKKLPSWTTIKKQISFQTTEELWQMVFKHQNDISQ